MTKIRKQKKAINLGRHAAECKICAHPQCKEIEHDFVDWQSPARIVKQYALRHRATVYRHAHALGLMDKRARNVRAALEKIIERAGEVEVTGASVVSAVGAYARINTAGQWVERSEHIDLNALFERMSAAELDVYAREGMLPDWFTSLVGSVARPEEARND